jgi:hypothetical protein
VGVPVSDVTSGFRAYGRVVIDFFGRRYPHELHDTSQLLLLSHYAGARIAEVPVEMRARASGSSEFGFARATFFPFLGLFQLVGCLLQRRRIATSIGR